MRVVFPKFSLFLVGLILLTSCVNIGQNTPVSSSVQVTLLPYSASNIPLSPTQALATLSPSPTNEPVIYTVVAGDSLSAIAFRFRVELDALMLANPTVNPNSMSIGTKLIIPAVDSPDQSGEAILTGFPTPVIQLTSTPDCYRVDTKAWICFLLVKNDQQYAIENVTGKILIPGSSASFTATCPLDFIPAGESLPLTVVIDLLENNADHVIGSLSSAIPVGENDPRFGTTTIINKQIKYSTDLRLATISGEVLVPVGGMLRVLGYAVDAQHHVVGYRIWDAPDSLVAGDSLKFAITIFSLGGEISEVYLFAQAWLK